MIEVIATREAFIYDEMPGSYRLTAAKGFAEGRGFHPRATARRPPQTCKRGAELFTRLVADSLYWSNRQTGATAESKHHPRHSKIHCNLIRKSVHFFLRFSSPYSVQGSNLRGHADSSLVRPAMSFSIDSGISPSTRTLKAGTADKGLALASRESVRV